MCLIITAFAAVVTTIVWYFKAHDKAMLGVLALMYWGATIMWLVDSIFCVVGGEPFFDISADDALLGLVIVLGGLVAWVIILLYNDPKKVFRTFQLKN